MDEQIIAIHLAAQHKITMTEFYQGDCLEIMKQIPDKSVDMILCDLPYAVTARNAWDEIIPYEQLWKAYGRIATDSAAMVFTATQPFASRFVCNSPIGWFKYEWIWKKSKITGVLNAKYQPVRQHEQILVFYRQRPIYNPQGLIVFNKITKQGGSSSNYGERSSSEYFQEYTNYPRSVLEIKSESKTVHPTQKPVALMEYLIKTYTNPGMVVLDNCMGSGTTGVAAKRLGRSFIGIEKDEKYFAIAKLRIEETEYAG